ncbi:MAG TPA: hypothetical protein VKV40_16780 [Ktedonobacteraceae bacterium]|nr:hypothetical protein [Ktedonobacteraceae bacterium]
MERSRWLLPFTHGVNMGAVDLVVALAERAGATLIAVSLLSESRTPGLRGARLEHIQQSKDFQEAVHWKAERYSVPVERYEIFTVDPMQHVPLLIADLRCEAIVLVAMGGREVFLQMHELKSLLEHAPAQLLIIRMSMPDEDEPPRSGIFRFLSWLPWSGRSGTRVGDGSLGKPDVSEAVGPSWIRTEG